MSSMSRRNRIALKVLIYGTVIGLLSYLVPMRTVVEKPESMRRMSDIKLLYIGIRLYADDHQDRCPPTLDALIEEKYLPKKPELLTTGSGEKQAFSPRLRYHKPSSDTVFSSLDPQSILLSYDHEKYEITVTADGSGQTRKKR